ncbi:hypothetical protein GPALN_007475 [Globodera pallida]|nr:hypothetical protein GPALN_007475 [Globodera pallida]
MSGTIGLKKHVHLPEPHKQEAEVRRQKSKDRVKEEPRLKPTRLLAQVRRSAPDEAYVAMKSDNALRAMMRRQKKKILGNVDCTDPLAFVIPAVLREKRGEDILLYDSRNFRPNEQRPGANFWQRKDLRFFEQTGRGTTGQDDNLEVKPATIPAPVEDEAYVAMKSGNALRAMMRRQKKKILGNVDCTDPLAFVIPAVLREKRGEDILLYDSRNFRPNEQETWTWHIDGTFKCAPALWEQCFVIGASVYHRMCICIWALLPGKNKNFKQLGLVPLYGQKNERGDAVRNSFRSVLSLPLLPPTVIRRAFTLIVDASPNGLEEFFLYFARTYIGLTQQQTEQGAEAFECSNPCRSVDSASECRRKKDKKKVPNDAKLPAWKVREGGIWADDGPKYAHFCEPILKTSVVGVQVYRVFGFVGQTHAIPLVTALMRGKTGAIYNRFWTKLRDELNGVPGDLQTTPANFDSEPALVNAFCVAFPEVHSKMCVFHVKQAINRRIQRMGYMELYSSSDEDGMEFQRIVRKIGALQFCPPNYIRRSLHLIRNQIDQTTLEIAQKAALNEILDYYVIDC